MAKATVKLTLTLVVSKVLEVAGDEIIDEDSAHDFVIGSDDGEQFFTNDFDLGSKDWELDRMGETEVEVQKAPEPDLDEDEENDDDGE